MMVNVAGHLDAAREISDPQLGQQLIDAVKPCVGCIFAHYKKDFNEPRYNATAAIFRAYGGVYGVFAKASRQVAILDGERGYPLPHKEISTDCYIHAVGALLEGMSMFDVTTELAAIRIEDLLNKLETALVKIAATTDPNVVNYPLINSFPAEPCALLFVQGSSGVDQINISKSCVVVLFECWHEFS